MILKKKKLGQITLSESSSLKEVVENLNQSGLRIVLLINKKKEFVGILQDSDIRRSLLKNYKIDFLVKKIVNKKPFTVKSLMELEKISVSELRRLNHVPIIKDKKIAGLYIHNIDKEVDQKTRLDENVIIMAGGFGKRLGTLTKKIPKPLLFYKNKTLLQHILDQLRQNNFYNVKISVFYLKKKIKNFIYKNKKFLLNIKFLEEKEPLGTIGSLRLVKKISKNFIVLNCDVITNVDLKNFLNFHKKNKSILTIGIKPFKYKNPYGVIISKNNKFLSFKEKPEINFSINAGLYAFNKKIIPIIKKYKFKDIQSLINHLLKFKYNISTFQIFENWIDLGQDKKNLKTSYR